MPVLSLFRRPPIVASEGRRPRVLLGATGSVAAITVAELAGKLADFADVRVVTTAAAQRFFSEASLPPGCRPLLGAPFAPLPLR